MCTLSFAPTETGYIVAMNRDEQISRVQALPPEITQLQDVQTVFPREGGAGTWIGVNEPGLCLALLNKNRAAPHVPSDNKSRGEIIPALLHLSSLNAVEQHLRAFPLNIFKPFRLIGISPEERATREWSWDEVQLLASEHDWTVRGWFSSSASDESAEKYRGRVFSQFAAGTNPATDELRTDQLRRLHASHENGPGPFSVCVHREHVMTVSYTEIVCGLQEVSLEYSSGAPCISQGQLQHVKISRSALRSR